MGDSAKGAKLWKAIRRAEKLTAEELSAIVVEWRGPVGRAEAAKMLGMSYSTFAHIERCTSPFSHKKLLLLAMYAIKPGDRWRT